MELIPPQAHQQHHQQNQLSGLLHQSLGKGGSQAVAVAAQQPKYHQLKHHAHKVQQIPAAEGFEGGRLLGRIGVGLGGFAVRGGGKEVEHPFTGSQRPAALCIEIQLFRWQGGTVDGSRSADLHPVAHLHRLPRLKTAEPHPPLLQKPPLGSHFAVILLIPAQRIAGRMDTIPELHGFSSSRSGERVNILPSSTIWQSRWYSASRAARPASVMQ